MSDSLVALAVLDGFWGQVFEYWPFFLTIGATLIFGVVSLLADLWWRKTQPPPAGALPRVDIPVDARVPLGDGLPAAGQCCDLAAAWASSSRSSMHPLPSARRV